MEWNFDKLCWEEVDQLSGKTSLKKRYKRYMNALTAVHNEVDKLGEDRFSDMDNEKLFVQTKTRKYVIYFK